MIQAERQIAPLERRFEDRFTQDRFLRRSAITFTIITLFIAGSVLVEGWFLGHDVFVRLFPGFAAMVPSTATSLAVLSAVQLLRLTGQDRIQPLVSWAAVGVAVFAIVNLGISAAQIGSIDLRSDRMSLATAFGLVLVAATQVSHHLGPRAAWVGTLLATVGLFLASVALVGYLFDAASLYSFILLSATALHSALSLFLLFLAHLVATARTNWLRNFLGRGPGARLARLLLPGAILIPAGLTYAAAYLVDTGQASSLLVRGMLVLALTVVLLAALVTFARVRNLELAQSRREILRLRDTLDALNVAAFVFDHYGRGLLMNQRAVELAGPSERPEDWFTDGRFYAIGTFAPLHGAAHPASLLEGPPPEDALYVGWLDIHGRNRSLRLSARRLTSEEGALDRIIVTVVDETESWNAKDEIAKIERLDAAGQITGGAAHEFSNILGAIQLTADMGLMNAEGAAREGFETIARACERGARMTDRLLRLSRDGLGLPQATDLVEALASIAKLAGNMMPESVRLSVDLPPHSHYAYVDPADLEAALLNLAINARNALVASGQSGEIRMALTTIDRKALISVSDDGPGMSPETLSRATTPFYTTQGEAGGSGLGLSQVEGFARRSGGDFDLRSKLRHGTEARVTLPLLDPDDVKAGRADPGPADLSGLRILVVEDDPQFGDVLPASLADVGADVAAFTNAEDALASFDPAAVDVLLTDVRLPGGMDGMTFAKHIRARAPDLPILFLTGYTEEGTTTRDDVGGIVLRKPIRLSMLTNAIDILRTRF
ncbi:ATP-binding protein [Maritimibacter dapengensis]|uniref:histidine kinase n=1 Tax=Maritimibacter dapengensis TaxID=2836868 RepID=A0ABS6T3P2_9RHOB|nr:ATP-binding protein [Maritimibacter dapengensis]MBV7378962.1 response regulator [Maritimibacter dapengensis]